MDSSSDLAHFGLGDVYFHNLKDYPRAIDEYRAGLQLGGIDAKVFLNLGASLNAVGQYSEAIEPLRRAVERLPRSSAVFRELALAYAALGKTEEAASAYQRAIQLDP